MNRSDYQNDVWREIQGWTGEAEADPAESSRCTGNQQTYDYPVRERHFLSAHQRRLQKNRGFEKMLNDLKAQASYEADEMERLKAEGREKSATYRQFFGNRLFYKQLLNTYKKYGLMD